MEAGSETKVDVLFLGVGKRAEDFGKQEFLLVWREHLNNFDLAITVLDCGGSVDPMEEEVLFLLVVRLIDEKLPEHLDVIDSNLNMCVANDESQQIEVGLNGLLMAIAPREHLVAEGTNLLDDF